MAEVRIVMPHGAALKPDGHPFRAMREVDTEGLNHYQLPFLQDAGIPHRR
jgi:hypothetical protein